MKLNNEEKTKFIHSRLMAISLMGANLKHLELDLNVPREIIQRFFPILREMANELLPYDQEVKNILGVESKPKENEPLNLYDLIIGLRGTK